jgi:tyrosyl-tRNA synthetase
MSKTTIPTPDQLAAVLDRGTSNVIVRDELVQKLQAGERLRVYLGVDPTGPQIHLGHAVVLRKLRLLQTLGHEIILLIGDFTARIGDPTGKDQARQVLTHEEILQNAASYQAQASTILDFDDPVNPAVLKYNAAWLDVLRFQDVIELASHFTVQQMMERDMFEQRLEAGKPIHLHEFLYPVMQGYDSVAMDVDLELGGNDQLFNMLAGRTLQHAINKKTKAVLTCDLLPGPDGRKMSKSYGNVIGVTDAPTDMFGKVMSLNDDVIPVYAKLCTDWTASEVDSIIERLQANENPRDIKVELAKAIVTIYHNATAADVAATEFFAVFADKGKPTDMPEYTLTATDIDVQTLLTMTGLATSKSEARRLMEQGGVKINDEKITDPQATPIFTNGDVLQVGKRRFVKLVV